MLNQSYEYYEFLSKILVKWLSERDQLQIADKYFVLLDSKEDTNNFYQSLEELDFDGKETFESKQYSYKTISYNKEGKQILFVAPVNDITQDFLVTVRNRVNANLGDWINTAVVFIVDSPLDSIMGGSYDLTQKGAPFHSQTIQNEVEDEIHNSKMSVGHQVVLENYLDDITDQTTTVLKDYETLFSILEKETISNENFNAMGYFPDEHLDTFDKKSIKNRLDENSAQYSEIEKTHEFFDVEDRLENKLEGKGLINELSDKDNWRKTPFTKIKDGLEKFEKLRKIDINIDTDKIIEDDASLWFRLRGATAAQRRKAYLIISSEDLGSDEMEITIPFDKRIKKNNVTESNTYIYEQHGVEHEDASYEVKNNQLIFKVKNIDPEKTYGGKISYKHENKNNLNFVITFMIVPFSLKKIEKMRSEFEITVLGSKKNRKYFFGMTNELQKYRFGNANELLIIDHPDQLTNQDVMNKTVELSHRFSGDSREDLRGLTNLNKHVFPIEFLDIDYRSIPSKAIYIEERRLGEKNDQFVYRDNKIGVGSSSISVEKKYQKWLKIEEQMLTKNSLYGSRMNFDYQEKELEIPQKIQDTYDKLLDYYKKEVTLPSLAIFNEKHISLLENIIDTIKELLKSSLEENQPMTEKIRNISKIGMVESNHSIGMSPLNPLLIGYQLELYYQLSDDVPKGHVLRTLNPENLLPYFKINDESYQSNYTSSVPRWNFYETLSKRKLSDLSSNIIYQRLDDYLTQYSFLFKTNPDMHLNVAGINIIDEVTFFNAIIHFMINRMSETKSMGEINPINIYVNLLGNSLHSLFHELYSLTTIEELNNHLKENIPKRIYDNQNREYSEYEVIEALQEKINIYQLPEEYNQKTKDLFFHITLYQFSQQDELNLANMRNLTKNYSMSGLLNNSEFLLDPITDKYMNGFGLGEDGESSSDFIQYVTLWNSFMSSVNKDTDSYQPENTWVNYIDKINNSSIDQLFDSSHWVTFLNLDVDLSYFYDEEERDLLVIHYADQSTSNQYESITVTNDTRQYEGLLKNAISQYSDQINTHEIIRNFNVINGQWLLKLISDQEKNKGSTNVFREKLSIISAYKELLGILHHPNFHWVPISLEEILRVSGMLGFSKKEGLFSAKNLGETGSTSDDLLMMGLEVVDGENIKIHFLPVEVKVGINSTPVIKKAEVQLEKTYNILTKYLIEPGQDAFMREYYLDFFVSLMITNLEKMLSSRIYTVEEIPNFKSLKNTLRSGHYSVSADLVNYYGKGIIYTFSKDTSARTSVRLSDSDITLIKVPEEDAYNIVSEDTREVIQKISDNQFGFSENILLNDIYSIGEEKEQDKEQDKESVAQEELEEREREEQNKSEEKLKGDKERKSETNKNEVESKNVDRKSQEPEEVVTKVIDTVKPEIPLDETRLLIGKVLNSSHQVYWEYGNKELSNRHMLITGKSGQGKTYFIQTLLSEFSKNNLSSLIVDYTDGFLADQLEEMLLEHSPEKIHTKFIYNEKLPLNPFKLQQLDLGGNLRDEKPRDMVDRVVQIIDFVFNLGIQQRALLTKVILEGYEVNQESYTFTHLRNDLIESGNSDREKLNGRLDTLLARDPFAYGADFSWKDIFNNKGEIHIFQLTGYQRNIQQVMIEFMLWDLFQYATKTGSEASPLPVILDEIQNLNFNINSPTVKILREGRKFGLSGIFATQSLDSINGQDGEAIYNAAQQIHFLPPDSQIRNLSRTISSSNTEVSEIESEFKKLHKGEAIVYGPMKNRDGSLTPPQKHSTGISSFEKRLDV